MGWGSDEEYAISIYYQPISFDFMHKQDNTLLKKCVQSKNHHYNRKWTFLE